MAVGQSQGYHFGVGATPILEPILVVGLGPVHWGTIWILTHGHIQPRNAVPSRPTWSLASPLRSVEGVSNKRPLKTGFLLAFPLAKQNGPILRKPHVSVTPKFQVQRTKLPKTNWNQVPAEKQEATCKKQETQIPNPTDWNPVPRRHPRTSPGKHQTPPGFAGA